MNKKQQQVAAYAFGVVFVVAMLAIALFVPQPTSFQYLVFRIVLSLATAGVAAMIPGFVQVDIPGIARAGGALAVFVVVFFYNPAALVSNRDTGGIEPLPPPIVNSQPSTPSNNEGISVAQLLEGHSKDEASRLFDLTFSNASDSQVLLNRLDVRWRYNRGVLKSVDHGAALIPIAEYVIDFPVDTDDEQWKTFSQIMSPSIALAPGTSKNPTLVTVRLQLHYHFAGRLDDHPAGGWNIIFDIAAESPTGQGVAIFKDANWRSR